MVKININYKNHLTYIVWLMNS